MANKVEIIVVAKDMTGPTFAKIERDAKAAGNKAGTAAGDGIKEGIEKSVKNTTIGLPGFEDSGRKSGASFATGFLSTIAELSAKAGSAIAEGVGSLLSNGTGPIAAGLQAGLIGGVLLATPLIASSIIGAIGGATLISTTLAGVIIAGMRDPSIAEAGNELWRNIFSRLGDASSSFSKPIHDALNMFEEEFSALEPRIANIFANSAESIKPLSEAVAGAFEDITVGIDNFIEKAGPEVTSGLAVGIRQVGEAVEYMFDEFEDADEIGTSTQTLFTALADSIVIVTNVLVALNERWAEFIGKIRAVNEAINPQEGDWVKVKGDLDELAGSYGGVADQANQAAGAMAHFYEETIKQSDPLLAYADAQRDAAEAREDMAEAERKYGKESEQYKEAVDRSILATLRMGQAAGDASESFDGHFTPAQYAALAALGLSAKEIAAYEERLRELKKEADGVKGDYEINILALGIGAAGQALASIKRGVDAIPDSKTVYVNVVAQGSGLAYRRTGGAVGAAATGGVRGNMTLVGEEGPEIVNLPFGSSVMPHGQTRRILADQARQDAGITPGMQNREQGSMKVDNEDVVNAIERLRRALIDALSGSRSGSNWGISERQGYAADLIGRAG